MLRESSFYAAVFKRSIVERSGKRATPSVGQIWIVNDRITYPSGRIDALAINVHRPNTVLLAAFEEDFEKNPRSVAQVLPISKWSIFASPHDLAFSSRTSPIPGLALMIECWNPRPVVRTSLLRAIAAVDQQSLDDVRYLMSCDLRGEQPKQALKSKGYAGPSIDLDDDPRTLFQKEEFDRTDFLSAQANTLI